MGLFIREPGTGKQLSSVWTRQRISRFLTGLCLGGILALVFGSFMPLLAQDADLENSGDNIATPPVVPVDIEMYWAAPCLRELAQRQIIPLDSQGRFYPEAPATWGLLTDVLNRSLPTETPYPGASLVEAALGLPSPVTVLYRYPDDRYDPGHPLTRSEAVKALAAKMPLPYVPRANELLSTSLVDGDQVPANGREGVAAALAARVLVNYPDAQRLNGDRLITRGEVAALACRSSPDSVLRSAVSLEWIARPQRLAAQEQPDSELRGVWLTNIDSDVLFSRENLADGIKQLKALNINTLYPVVWNFGYPQFPSDAAEQIIGKRQRLWPGDNPAFEATQQGRDMLQEIIELAHTEGMAVIPWFEFGFLAPAEYVLLDDHPDWFTQRQDGTRKIQQGEETFTWMNPLHPRTQQLLLLLMNEVLENYDVEGIQVDDHLGMPVDMGYDDFTVALYRKEHGGQSPPDNYADPEWMRWRADKITGFMAKVRQLIDLRQPGALLSVSPNPYPFSYQKYLQDWPTWNEQGWLDELIIQVYRNDIDRFVWELNKPALATARRQTPISIGLLSGLKGRPTDVSLLTRQLEAVRDRDYAGVSYFFYQTLWTPGRETAEERNTQLRATFAQPASRP